MLHLSHIPECVTVDTTRSFRNQQMSRVRIIYENFLIVSSFFGKYFSFYILSCFCVVLISRYLDVRLSICKYIKFAVNPLSRNSHRTHDKIRFIRTLSRDVEYCSTKSWALKTTFWKNTTPLQHKINLHFHCYIFHCYILFSRFDKNSGYATINL